MDKNEVKKDLYKSKELANFICYDGDKAALIFHIKVFGKLHEFPVYTTAPEESGGYQPAPDLKGAKFFIAMKGSDLNRWISKAIDANELVNLTEQI